MDNDVPEPPLEVPEWCSSEANTSDAQQDETQLSEVIERIEHAQVSLGQDFERLAQAVTPLLTSQFNATHTRVRTLEKRILSRQERPIIVRLAELLTNMIRIESDREAKIFAVEGLVDVLEQTGYQRFGRVGDKLDDTRHDVVEAEPSEHPLVTRVFAKGLESYGDVLIRARVGVGPPSRQSDDDTATRRTQ